MIPHADAFDIQRQFVFVGQNHVTDKMQFVSNNHAAANIRQRPIINLHIRSPVNAFANFGAPEPQPKTVNARNQPQQGLQPGAGKVDQLDLVAAPPGIVFVLAQVIAPFLERPKKVEQAKDHHGVKIDHPQQGHDSLPARRYKQIIKGPTCQQQHRKRKK